MAAFAKVQLTQPGTYEGAQYDEGAVLRLPSDVAARLVRRGRAEPYDGTAHPKNEPKEEAPKASKRRKAEPEETPEEPTEEAS